MFMSSCVIIDVQQQIPPHSTGQGNVVGLKGRESPGFTHCQRCVAILWRCFWEPDSGLPTLDWLAVLRALGVGWHVQVIGPA